jgi:hypothetical protein
MTSSSGGGGRKVIALTDRPLAYRTAIARIKLLWREENVTWSRHFEDRLTERQLDMTDVESIIRTGQVVEQAGRGSTGGTRLTERQLKARREDLSAKLMGICWFSSA